VMTDTSNLSNITVLCVLVMADTINLSNITVLYVLVMGRYRSA